MAKFEIAERITGRNEGGYANNPSDTGGETFAGIARNHWPKWTGWRIIDNIKFDLSMNDVVTPSKINKAAKANHSLTQLISDFYKENFWNKLKLDQICDQQIANTVYDFAVNSGTSRAAKFLQAVIGTTSDGIVGPKTIAAVNKLNSEETYTKFNDARETFYRGIAKGNQAQFLKSWLSRLKPYQNA